MTIILKITYNGKVGKVWSKYCFPATPHLAGRYILLWTTVYAFNEAFLQTQISRLSSFPARPKYRTVQARCSVHSTLSSRSLWFKFRLGAVGFGVLELWVVRVMTRTWTHCQTCFYKVSQTRTRTMGQCNALFHKFNKTRQNKCFDVSCPLLILPTSFI